MNPTQTILLAEGAHRVWRVACSVLLTAREGCVWVTVANDPVDYWLMPGEVLPVSAGEAVRIGGWNAAVSCEIAPLETSGPAGSLLGRMVAGCRVAIARMTAALDA